MSDKIQKFLAALEPKQFTVIQALLHRIVTGNLAGLDVKKMAGKQNEFRVRKGKIRIVFDQDRNILDIDYRGNIYK